MSPDISLRSSIFSLEKKLNLITTSHLCMREISNLFNTLMLRKRLSFAFLSVLNEVMVAEKTT